MSWPELFVYSGRGKPNPGTLSHGHYLLLESLHRIGMSCMTGSNKWWLRMLVVSCRKTFKTYAYWPPATWILLFLEHAKFCRGIV